MPPTFQADNVLTADVSDCEPIATSPAAVSAFASLPNATLSPTVARAYRPIAVALAAVALAPNPKALALSADATEFLPIPIAFSALTLTPVPTPNEYFPLTERSEPKAVALLVSAPNTILEPTPTEWCAVISLDSILLPTNKLSCEVLVVMCSPM